MSFNIGSQKARFGLVGFGLFGAHHAAAIQKCRDAELVAIAVTSADGQTRARTAHPQAVIVADYRQLLARDDIDVVSVVAPNRVHAEIAAAAMAAGKHVLLEKPMALSIADCDRLIELAEKQQRILAVGHELRLSSLWGGAKQLIESGAIGRPLHVLVELSRFPYRQGSQGWRYDPDRVGSWVLEEPIHFFDLARWYLSASGDPVSVYARANSRQAGDPRLLDNFSAVVNHADGAYAVVSQTLAAFGHHQTAKIAGTEGTIWAWWSAADARSDRPTFGLRYGLGDQVSDLALEKPAGELLELADEVAAVARCVLNGGQPPCRGVDGRWATLLCLAAEQSISSGLPVDLEKLVADAARRGSTVEPH